MTRDVVIRILRRALRTIAVAIAVAAAIDPELTTNRTSRPEIVVRALDSLRDAALADRVARSVSKRYSVVRAPLAGASATVLVGDRVANVDDEPAAPVFAVLPENTGPSVAFERLDVPPSAPSDARVPVVAFARVTGAAGRTVDVTLAAGGLVVDRVTRKVDGLNQLVRVPLTFVPSSATIVRLRVTASLGDTARAAVADVAVNVREQRWPVLFFDPRPSWMSTFVRRAIERDTRFVVTSRIVTSRNVSSDAGRPPGRLDDLAALSLYDAIVVGAPEALSPQDVAGLEAFMRRRGGSVVLLLDQRVPGAYDRLTDVASWASNTDNRIVAIASAESDSSLRATELAWPAKLPAGAEPLAGGVRPVIWRSSVGAGHLVVSGALDAWRFRGDAASGFDRFWQMLVADAANASVPPLSIGVSDAVASPGERVNVSATVRDAAILDVSIPQRVRSSVSAALEPGGVVRLWPSAVGEFRGTVRAPAAPGVYRLAVSADGNRADVPIVVARDVRRPVPMAWATMATWVAARGGQAIPASRLQQLVPALDGVLRPIARMESWHPMRSAWWLVPFVLALSGEWWLRRRRGLA